MLRTRIATAAVLVAILLAALYLSTPAYWLALCLVLTSVAGWEWGKLSDLSSVMAVFYALGLAGAIAFLALFAAESGVLVALISSVLFWLFIAPWWLADRSAMRGTSRLLIAGAIVLAATCLALVTLREQGISILLGTMAIVWISDTVAYFVGKRYGAHKLAPTVSPGKTWEGVWGAFAAVGAFGLLWWFLSPDTLPVWLQRAPLAPLAVLVSWIALAACGILGDLLESQLKRAAGVKDSGRILPGHGGILDRVDALTAALPFAACLYLLK